MDNNTSTCLLLHSFRQCEVPKVNQSIFCHAFPNVAPYTVLRSTISSPSKTDHCIFHLQIHWIRAGATLGRCTGMAYLSKEELEQPRFIMAQVHGAFTIPPGFRSIPHLSTSSKKHEH